MDGSKGLNFDFTGFDNTSNNPCDILQLPVDGLPRDLKDLVNEVAEGYQCPRDYAVASMMAAASTAIGKGVSCRFDNFLNYGSLWLAIVGETSDGKSAPLSFFFEPFEDLEEESYRQYRRELKEWEQGDKKADKPQFYHKIINNASDEAVLRELRNNGAICWKTDELRTMFSGFGKYSGGSGVIVGNLLSIFNYNSITVSRVTTDPVYLRKPCMTIVGGLQPDVLKRIMKEGNYAEDGLLQRFLYVFPKQRELPAYKRSIISDEAKRTWRAHIERLSGLDGLILSETQEAYRLHVEALNRWRGLINEQYKDNAVMASLCLKMGYHICRWSIVAAVLRGSMVIDEAIIRWCVDCMDYFINTGEKVYCLIANSEPAREPTSKEVIAQLCKQYPSFNQTKLAEALGVSQSYISKCVKETPRL